jgi:hypothetical protein
MATNALRALGEAVAQATGKRIVSCLPLAKSGGYTRALRCQARFADGTSVFVKAATEPDTTKWIHHEAAVYEALGEQPFLAHYYGSVEYGDDTAFPAILLEDLTEAYWGPPWRNGEVEKVIAALDAIHPLADRFPAGFLPAQEEQRPVLVSWELIAADPEPFLSLGFCTRAWLDAALPALIHADRVVVLDGDDLIHQDIRSDNICFPEDGRVIIVDWNWACRGNAAIDLAAWLPSLHREGGPAPETILFDKPELAGMLAGFWAYRAPQPAPDFPGGERIRQIQTLQVKYALPWAAKVLGLPPPL